MEKETVTGLEFRSLNDEIKQVMRRSAADVVKLGYLLRRMMDNRLWERMYNCFDEYLETELHMDYTMANRFVGINKKYSVDGGSADIDTKWEGYSQAVLIEMLSMPPELEGQITPDMTVRQVREVKRRARKEASQAEKMVFQRKTITAVFEMRPPVLKSRDQKSNQESPKEQPPLPVLKNNTQRKEWLGNYKAWGLWYHDENIGVDYYKYDFANGARLIAEVYQEEATQYRDAYDSCYLHLVGGPKPPTGHYGVGKWQWHKKYSRFPNSETELVEFLKEVQKKK